ncbi:lamin tail domain-containing protein [Iodobacter ciconiae]|uniref:LTD domain-containing protein n=1 Tax=Iodobacter ciconiae TaxID=2496266 RepID=A0A3S8ZSY3_9NEIS|nr:lamin tail domain-containing protein [Iodobacter ciconiae]AZN36588.1 hypothetical protein EJO50_08815 [Iodobacter ciconiae]
MNNDHFQQYGARLACLSLSVILVACGGGGGGDTGSPVATSVPTLTPTSVPTTVPTPAPTLPPIPTPTPEPVLDSALLISEVSSNYGSAKGAWLEIYNNGAQDVSLDGVSLRTSLWSNWTSFDLPKTVVIKPGAYFIVAGKSDDAMQSANQIAYVNNLFSVPDWGSSGAVELVKGGVTLDFVRFGNNQAQPLTAGAWEGVSAVSIPSFVWDYGHSLVRLGPLKANTRSAQDWTVVPFSTPGGPNDVPENAVDNDKDGIPDYAEVAGGTFGGIDYYAMGARANQPDIFIQIDHMKSTDLGIIPTKEALQKVVDAFKLNHVAVHFDAGNLYNVKFNPADFNLGGSRLNSRNEVAYQACLGIESLADCASIYDYKNLSMDIRRKQVFHYLLMGNSQELDGKASYSGYAEIAGNDIIVTLGNWGLNADSPEEMNQLINYQASTIMHELGHNLGLKHGGNEDINNKPNYYSVMNYLYQLNGLGSTPKSISGMERYFFAKEANGFDWGSLCKLEGGPCDSRFRIDYSDGSGSFLDENSLNEANLIGRGRLAGVYADWNLDNKQNTVNYALDINDDGNKQVLRDHNDWANLNLAFARVESGNSGASMQRSAKVAINPILNDKQRWSVEAKPSAAFFAAIRRRAR